MNLTNFGYSTSSLNQTPTQTSSKTPQQQIDDLKAQLSRGGLSQAEADAIANQIRSLGGKVQLGNYGYEGGAQQRATETTAPTPTPNPSPTPTQTTDPSPIQPKNEVGTTAGTQEDVVDATGDIRRKDPASAAEAEMLAEDFNANKTIEYNNPFTMTPFGSSGLMRDANGNLVYSQNLSPEQQGILNAQQGLTTASLNSVSDRLGGFSGDFNPNLTDRSMQDDLIAERQRIEDQLYGRLTRNLERDRGRELESAEQTLYNKGIPFSADPESRYQKELSVIQQRYDDRDANARAQATQLGGDEFLRQFGAQEQLRANQLAEQGGIRSTNLGELGTLQGFGSGLMLPNLPGYQGPGAYNPYSPFDIWSTMQGNLQGWQGVRQGQQAVDQARPTYGGGGGGYAPPATPVDPGPPIVAPPSGL